MVGVVATLLSNNCSAIYVHSRSGCPVPRRKSPSKKIPISHLAPLLIHSRLWLRNCFRVLISGAFAFAYLHTINADVASAFTYPCEDVGHYYEDVDGVEGVALMKKLNSIVSPHRSLPYKDVWEALKILDAADVDDPESSSEVVEVYSQRAVSKLLAGKPEGWNREHLWPRSYGLTDGPSLTDLHNIRPADVNVNSSRGNKYFGECISTSTRCLRPANKEAAFDTETDNKRWAPPLLVRGDIARSLMYMAISYGFHQPDGTPHLKLSDSPSIESSKMGLLSSLLRWNELDPPSRSEQLRNSRICSLYQHNRNPFVDHPEYANLIWGHLTTNSSIPYNSSKKAWINEFHYDNKGKDQNEFIEVVISPSTEAATLKLILYNGANGQMYHSVSLADKQAFSVSSGGSDYQIYTIFISLQNGPADGIALVSSRDGNSYDVLQFISYEGKVKAVDGPAEGLESVDIMVQETDESSESDSLGLTGQRIGEFAWKKLVGESTPGKPNVDQTLYP
ncbi:uncharacterized protein [Typha angustifolia]|uniref:uncharacterized protein isoform X2 n=1 Tax=Typha angustifolia TaxID=59011 RepID=UPI003C306BBF